MTAPGRGRQPSPFASHHRPDFSLAGFVPAELTIKTMGCNGMINSWYKTDMPRDAVVGQFLFWTLREVGHAVFDICQVPLFGREEDAADQFPVYIMLQFGRECAHQLVEGAAYAANTFMKNYRKNLEVEKRLEKYSSIHGLPEQRFYNFYARPMEPTPTGSPIWWKWVPPKETRRQLQLRI
jgi:Putative metallopeptidase